MKKLFGQPFSESKPFPKKMIDMPRIGLNETAPVLKLKKRQIKEMTPFINCRFMAFHYR